VDPDLDPHQNVMDPEHWFFPTAVADIFLSGFVIECIIME
jgi:hypothetical protein